MGVKLFDPHAFNGVYVKNQPIFDIIYGPLDLKR